MNASTQPSSPPAVAEGEPIPGQGHAVSPADLRRAERERALCVAASILGAASDLVSEAVVFFVLVGAAVTTASSTVALWQVLLRRNHEARLVVCPIAHPAVAVQTLVSVLLGIPGNSGAFHAHFRITPEWADALRFTLFLYELALLAPAVTPYSVFARPPQLSPATCDIDLAGLPPSEGGNPFPAVGRAIVAHAMVRGGTLVLLWGHMALRLLRRAVRQPGYVVLLVGANLWIVAMSVLFLRVGGAVLNDTQAMGIALFDSVVLHNARAVARVVWGDAGLVPAGSCLGVNVFLSAHDDPLAAFMASDALPVCAAMLFVLLMAFGAPYVIDPLPPRWEPDPRLDAATLDATAVAAHVVVGEAAPSAGGPRAGATE
jgi:hypothetical protein